MSRLRWIGWAVGLILVVILLIWAQGPLRSLAAGLIGRVKLREREAAERLEETKRKDAITAIRQAKSSADASAAMLRANKAFVKATEIEKERKELAAELERKIDDEERARKFRERHGLSDPCGDSS